MPRRALPLPNLGAEAQGVRMATAPIGGPSLPPDSATNRGNGSVGEEALIHVVYVSSATRLLVVEEVDSILAVSRRNNARVGLTGMLLYVDGNFIQLLEGTEPAVLGKLAVIEKDPRHRGITQLVKTSIRHRHFPEWKMGYADARDLAEKPEGLSGFLTDPHGDALDGAPATYRLLLSFRENMQTGSSVASQR